MNLSYVTLIAIGFNRWVNAAQSQISQIAKLLQTGFQRQFEFHFFFL